jgi:hypothetical protein
MNIADIAVQGLAANRRKMVNDMPRYIDADEALRMMKNSKQDNPCQSEHKGIWNTAHECCMSCVYAAPTADVVPKSDVDELIYKLECLLCHATGGRLSKHTYDLMTMEAVVTDYIDEAYCEGKETAKSEVAREIFEEIEKAMADLEYRANTPRKTVKVEELKDQVNWVLHEVVPKTIAELKKKYTEGSE